MKMRSLLVAPCVAVFACAAFAATFPRAVEASPHIVECRSEGGSLSVSLAGAQTTSWRPAALGGGEAFFMPSKTPWGEEVHGGLPLCWPWVGRRKGLPIHGLVRYMQWRLARRLDSSCVELATESNADTLALWPHKFRLTARISIVDAATIEVVLSETNTGDEPFESAFGIHPYFSVSDSCSVSLDGRRLPRPVGETTKFPADGEAHALSDMLNGRTYSINAPYADTWWVWNPGTETTPEMKTLAPDEWRRFWCLEALRRHPKPLAPGETRVSSVRLAVRRMPAKDAKPYMVIDLSGGPDAASYPISSIDAEPQGGWTDEYKTTKLVLRRIEPGTCTMGCKASETGYQDGNGETPQLLW